MYLRSFHKIVKYAFCPDVFVSKDGICGILTNFSHVLRGTIDTSHSARTVRKPDSLGNVDVRYLIEVFMPVFWFY